jgi:hypothetical protein
VTGEQDWPRWKRNERGLAVSIWPKGVGGDVVAMDADDPAWNSEPHSCERERCAEKLTEGSSGWCARCGTEEPDHRANSVCGSCATALGLDRI